MICTAIPEGRKQSKVLQVEERVQLKTEIMEEGSEVSLHVLEARTPGVSSSASLRTNYGGVYFEPIYFQTGEGYKAPKNQDTRRLVPDKFQTVASDFSESFVSEQLVTTQSHGLMMRNQKLEGPL
jgi:hypothetical protein